MDPIDSGRVARRCSQRIEGLVEFFRVTTGLVATRLRIRVEPGPESSSIVHISYAFTPLSESGRAFVAESHSEDAFGRDMAWWEESMNHWLRCGRILREPAH